MTLKLRLEMIIPSTLYWDIKYNILTLKTWFEFHVIFLFSRWCKWEIIFEFWCSSSSLKIDLWAIPKGFLEGFSSCSLEFRVWISDGIFAIGNLWFDPFGSFRKGLLVILVIYYLYPILWNRERHYAYDNFYYSHLIIFSNVLLKYVFTLYM